MNNRLKHLSSILTVLLILFTANLYGYTDNNSQTLDIEPNTTAFDFDHGDASIEVVVPNVVPAVYESVSSSTGNATLVLRITTFVTNAWFDATAPYHDTAVGVYSSLGRRPATESQTHRNMNIALIHASYHVLLGLIPEQEQRWRKMLLDVGLDPDNASEDITTPEGIGNLAGKAIIRARINHGMNQLCDA